MRMCHAQHPATNSKVWPNESQPSTWFSYDFCYIISLIKVYASYIRLCICFFRIQLACYSPNRATPGSYIRSELDQSVCGLYSTLHMLFFVYSSLAIHRIELPRGAIFEVSLIKVYASCIRLCICFFSYTARLLFTE